MAEPRTTAARTRRDRKTRRTVLLVDRLARTIIAVGGIGTIAAVGLVCVFLVWVAAPLFLPVHVGEPKEAALEGAATEPTHKNSNRPGESVNEAGGAEEILGLLAVPVGGGEIRVHRDGRIERHAIVSGKTAGMLETVDASQSVGPGANATAWAAFAGGRSWAIGDNRGTVRIWFLARSPEDRGGLKPGERRESSSSESLNSATPVDGWRLTAGHVFFREGYPVRRLAASKRGRILAVGYDDGLVRLYQPTAERLLAEIPFGGTIEKLALSAKNDELTVEGGGIRRVYALNMPHPDVSLKSLFFPVWYEGYHEPAMVWQSSGGDATEMKLGLTPLIFGTIKATFYSMLFGSPLALLAAVYTSQFMGPKMRSWVKPSLEFMASLPSVVLGIVAALLVAPWVEGRLVAVLASLYTAPAVLLLCAHLWQMLPDQASLRSPNLRLLSIAISLPAGVAMAFILAPAIERVLFGGDVVVWLDGLHQSSARESAAYAGWVFPSIPLAAAAVCWAVGRWCNPWINRKWVNASRQVLAIAHAVKFAAAMSATLIAAWLLAMALGAVFEPRGLFVDTYDQRNALVVGFVMGFAVIPIIYTVADDALTAVPESLKSASLGAGATQWQTTVRIVIPAAISGIFSALMIGLGRAVGETMIVLMAAGNTPIMEWNVFSGFRTLSANIAVEIPEAVRNSTHYRTLFLAALALFSMTFVLNTAAEIVRRRFRSRAQS